MGGEDENEKERRFNEDSMHEQTPGDRGGRRNFVEFEGVRGRLYLISRDCKENFAITICRRVFHLHYCDGDTLESSTVRFGRVPTFPFSKIKNKEIA